ncbi:MAG: 3'-5' exonuclease [Ilumatobacter sp.]|uniref:3'-5' exonuclease n=1 Tax=Ilumatobacter sp. TaxID=1967498 RepID=UPI0032976DC8
MRILQTVTPTPEQLPLIGDNKPGVRIVHGAAGSGKTTTAIHRLRQLRASRLARRQRLGSVEPVRIHVFTYNRTLEGYIRELAVDNASPDTDVELGVSTFAKWSRSITGQERILNRGQSAAILGPLVRALPRGAELQEFFIDEVDYALSRFEPGDLKNYLDFERTGRGAAPRVDRTLRAKILADVIEPYAAAKAARSAMDWNDVANAAAAAPPTTKFDIVIVDEAQDFSANQIRALMAHTADTASLTFVLDAIQRIYPRYFRWNEVGIDVRPEQVTRLRTNYRNTAEIAALAAPLVDSLPTEEYGALPDFSACVESGQRPEVIAGTYRQQIEYMLDRLERTVDLANESVAILQPRGGAWFDFARQCLDRRGLAYCELQRNDEWPSGPEQIGLCTIHSAKGLEFDHVLLPGLNQQVTPHGSEDGDAGLDRLRRLLAMGIGRARKTVAIGYKPSEASSLISLLDESTFDRVSL